VLLDGEQFRVLTDFMQDIRQLGDDLNFVLERCEDYRASQGYAGHGISWDNGGSDAQDDEVERLIGGLHQALFSSREYPETDK
jgi:hypothetical protein